MAYCARILELTRLRTFAILHFREFILLQFSGLSLLFHYYPSPHQFPCHQMATKEEKQPMHESDDTGKQADNTVKLKPKITLINGITMIVGSVIGSGIFVSPKGVQQHVGSVGMSLIIWLLCGIFSIIGAQCYAELGTMIVKSGADYAYIYEAFGPFMAFLRLWVEVIVVRPCSQAIVALTFSYYILDTIYPDCEKPEVPLRILAAVCIC